MKTLDYNKINARRTELENLLAEPFDLEHDELEAYRTEMFNLTVKLHQDDPDYISEDSWYEKYTPVKNKLDNNAAFDGCMFETYDKELEYVKNSANKSKKVWTIVEGDYGTLMISAGFHFVNRQGYLITEEDYPSEAAYVILE